MSAARAARREDESAGDRAPVALEAVAVEDAREQVPLGELPLLPRRLAEAPGREPVEVPHPTRRGFMKHLVGSTEAYSETASHRSSTRLAFVVSARTRRRSRTVRASCSFCSSRSSGGSLPAANTAPGAQPMSEADQDLERYCLLATVADGVAHARVLQPFPPDRDFTVWLGTTRGSRKVEQLRNNPVATLAYEDDARGACAVLVGRAEIIEDVSERQRRFKPFWRAFWPDGPEGADYVLIRFHPNRIEVWDAWRGVTPAPFGQRSAIVARGPDGAWRAA